MKKAGKVIVCMLAAAMLISHMVFAAGASNAGARESSVQPGLSRQAMYEWNMGKAVAVTELDEVSEGTCWIVTKEQDVTKAPDVDLACEMLSYYRVEAYFGEDVMRNRALEANNSALIMYNYLRTAQSCDDLFKPESYTYAEFLRSFSSSVFVDQEGVEHKSRMNYRFRMDANYKDLVKAGDTVIMVLDNSISPWGEAYAMVQPYAFHEHLRPYIAKFVDGKLQMDEEIADGFKLYRLYDDTEPQLTGIKDGDSVEDVVAFLKAVEEDMIRYEKENGLDVCRNYNDTSGTFHLE